MVPYGLGQEVKFKKNFGPMLGEIDIDKLKTIDENDFVNKLFFFRLAICQNTVRIMYFFKFFL